MSDGLMIGGQYKQMESDVCGWLSEDNVCESPTTFAVGVAVEEEDNMVSRVQVCDTHLNRVRDDPRCDIRWIDTGFSNS